MNLKVQIILTIKGKRTGFLMKSKGFKLNMH